MSEENITRQVLIVEHTASKGLSYWSKGPSPSSEVKSENSESSLAQWKVGVLTRFRNESPLLAERSGCGWRGDSGGGCGWVVGKAADEEDDDACDCCEGC